MELTAIDQVARLEVSEIQLDIRTNKLMKELHDYDSMTYVHCQNTAYITSQICQLLSIDKDERAKIVTAALLHDIGKIYIPKYITIKKGRLTPVEYDNMKTHTQKGYKKLKQLGYDPIICDIALYHHEKVDGSGYPCELKDYIPLPVQIVSIVDTYDAMTAKRTYGQKYTANKAIQILQYESFGSDEMDIISSLSKCNAI